MAWRRKNMSNVEDTIKNVARQQNQNQTKVEEMVQLVVFELDKEEYAVEIADLQEIITIPEITPIPNAPQFISGILNLRGKISVVVDLEKRFNLVRDNNDRVEGNIIITEVDGNNFGVIVDKVSEIITVPISSIQATPALVSSKIHAEYLKGVVVIIDQSKKIDQEKKNGSRLVILLDLQKMLQEKELLQLGQTIKGVTDK